jgi:hypothetical protein
VEGAFALEGGEKRLEADLVARDVRITLGQLPADLRSSVRLLRVFGQGDTAEELAEELQSRVEPMGLKVEQVRQYAPGEFGVKLAANTAPSPALSLAVRRLAGQGTGLEFLPPKITQWQQMTARYSSGKLLWTGATVGAVALLVVLVFAGQLGVFIYWQRQWEPIRKKVSELEGLQTQIKRYRPWFDDSFREMNILRCLTDAFPEDGSVSAKTIGIRDPATVTCAGTARDLPALNKMTDRLRAFKEVADVQTDQIRGKSPLEFTLNFRWKGAAN